ncbi:hypothetical protein [Kamptonema sp. UHCC 0994]|uniref:hypothetical protein n=1 Tax=Kamptonema sp. UHCC 0994 TaxID=3031329 RepID=UPI0023B89A21|nr:hypothetical protein [Kamptonema sp. UHCC 0994]MDF0551728.1 hypothetical protein [Kamptonema sp. UHCC 0994]
MRNQVSNLTLVRMLKIIDRNQCSSSETIKSSVKDAKTYPQTGGKSRPRSLLQGKDSRPPFSAKGLRPETLAIGILRLESLKNPRVFRPGSVNAHTSI